MSRTGQLSLAALGGMSSGAVFSPCRKYRYRLYREWGSVGDRCVFLMLNPSEADEVKQDPTVTRCIDYAKRWGYGALDVVNLFAWKSTDPGQLYELEDPIGPENDASILAACAAARRVVCAWGNHGGLLQRGRHVRGLLHRAGIEALCFKLTNMGEPIHPLYQPATLVPVPMPDLSDFDGAW